jgi:hypothetical protein
LGTSTWQMLQSWLTIETSHSYGCRDKCVLVSPE